MKKLNNLAFMLTETLIVSTFVTSALLYMFIQFKQTYQNYQRTFSYNTVNSLYATNQIKKYILDVDFNNIKNRLDDENSQYINVTGCADDLFLEPTYCNKLFTDLNVKDVYFTLEDITNLKDQFKLDYNVDAKTITFLDYITYDKNNNGYRLIVHFKDNTHATLKLGAE